MMMKELTLLFISSILIKYLSARIILFFGFETHMIKTSLENPLSRSPLLANTTLFKN